VFGLLLLTCAYWMRDSADLMPMVEVMLLVPCSVLAGFRVARGGTVELGMAAGTATATTGHLVAVVAIVLYLATTGPWLVAVAWAFLGVALAIVPVVLGATFGAMGAVLSRHVKTTRW
jgi:hypothetical protein